MERYMPDEITKVLKDAKTIAIVGLSKNPENDSYNIGLYLQRAGYRIIPINPTADKILGEQSYPDLRSVPHRIDIVDVFRRPEHVPPVIDEALSLGIPVIWLQAGITVDDSLADKVNNTGALLVQNQCISVAHRFSIARHGGI
jgi:uncharacterized protein